MSKYPQIHVKEKYQDFLVKLTGVGKPSVVDRQYIRKLGYKSSYDANFLPAVKFIGLVEEKRGGAPTERWGELRSDFGGTLATCLREGYADLFEFYPDAHLRDDEALSSYFRGNSDGSQDEVDRMVTAFNAVKELAKFSSELALEGDPKGRIKHHEVISRESPSEQGDGENREYKGDKDINPSININIQLQLPSDATGEVYEKFFEAMRNKLFPRS